MSRPAPARRAALAVLGDVRRRDARARDVLRESPRLAGLAPRDVALAERLVLGVTAARGSLDALLDAHLARPGSVEPRVRDALRLAAFELCHLSTPGAVAASQGVELVRSVAPRAAGLANAVLRRVASEDVPRVRAARARLDDAAAVTEADLALAAAWPAWLARRALASLGPTRAAAMAACSLDAAPVWVSGNAALHDAVETRTLFEAAGLAPAEAGLPGVWRLDSAAGLAASGLVASADVVVSDLAARAVVLAASPAPGARVLEVGQGRGTKTLLLEACALGLGGPAHVTGVDVSAFKAHVARERLAHGWGEWVRCLVADARGLAGPMAGLPAPGEPGGAFDLVLVDAPCSGTGTLRRHPEIAWDLDEAALDPARADSLPRLQLDVLAASATRVAPGGTLAYATCSVLAEECGEVVSAFLAGPAGRGFRPVAADARPAVLALPAPARALVSGWVGADGALATSPAAGGPDGHFCALLERVG